MSKSQKTLSGTDRDIEFNVDDFARVRDLIYRLAGISLSDTKQKMVYSRLAKRIRATGALDFQDYLNMVESNLLPDEVTEFVNALTTNLTSFFREAYHFPLLASHLKDARLPLKIWCSAASTGEEPYSIAMTVVEMLGKAASQVSIVASDIDTAVLGQAARGVYPMDRVAKLSTERLHRFFLKGKGDTEGFVKVRRELRNMIEFRQLNLTHEHWDLQGPFDVIFCRNVMIYFDRATQTKVIENMVRQMTPNGLFFAGHSENFQFVTRLLRPLGHTVYTPLASTVRPKRSDLPEPAVPSSARPKALQAEVAP